MPQNRWPPIVIAAAFLTLVMCSPTGAGGVDAGSVPPPKQDRDLVRKQDLDRALQDMQKLIEELQRDYNDAVAEQRKNNPAADKANVPPPGYRR